MPVAWSAQDGVRSTGMKRLIVRAPLSYPPAPAPARYLVLMWVRASRAEHRTTIAAAVASVAATTAGFPLDSLKSRLQVKRYASVFDCALQTWRAEGVGGFYRGIAVPMLTVRLHRSLSNLPDELILPLLPRWRRSPWSGRLRSRSTARPRTDCTRTGTLPGTSSPTRRSAASSAGRRLACSSPRAAAPSSSSRWASSLLGYRSSG